MNISPFLGTPVTRWSSISCKNIQSSVLCRYTWIRVLFAEILFNASLALPAVAALHCKQCQPCTASNASLALKGTVSACVMVFNWGLGPNKDQTAKVVNFHTVKLSHSFFHTLTFSHFHTLTLSHSQTITLSHFHFITLSHYHTFTLSHSRTVTLWHYHTITLSH